DPDHHPRPRRRGNLRESAPRLQSRGGTQGGLPGRPTVPRSGGETEQRGHPRDPRGVDGSGAVKAISPLFLASVGVAWLLPCFFLALIASRPAWSGDEALTENPPPATPQEVTSPQQESFESAPQPPPNAISEALDKALEHLTPVLRDTKLTLKPRIYYFESTASNGKQTEAVAGGGSVEYTSGWLAN